MAGLCPPASWTSIPELDRQTIPAILFAPGCLPGTTDAAGVCKTKDLRYTIAIPWETFKAQAHKAPGGNLYWNASVPADPRDPTAFWLMNQMAISNLVKFQARGKRGKELVSELLAKGFVTKIGNVKVPLDPLPNEKTDAFVARGGQLFYPPGSAYCPFVFNGNVSESHPIYSLVPRQLVGEAGGRRRTPTELLMYGAVPDWMEDVRSIQMYANYAIAENKINYTIRLEWTNAGARVVDSTVNWIAQNASKLCTKLNDPTVVVATTAAGATPVTAPYAAGATAVRQLCNVSSVMSGCVPRTPGSPGTVEALLMTPIVLPTKYMRFEGPKPANVKPHALVLPGITVTATAVNPNTPIVYPTGTIAWQNTKVAGYDVAVPQTGQPTPYRIAQRSLTSPPAAARLVERDEWEKAVYPWTQRTNTKIGFGVAALALATTVGVVAIRARRKR